MAQYIIVFFRFVKQSRDRRYCDSVSIKAILHMRTLKSKILSVFGSIPQCRKASILESVGIE